MVQFLYFIGFIGAIWYLLGSGSDDAKVIMLFVMLMIYLLKLEMKDVFREVLTETLYERDSEDNISL